MIQSHSQTAQRTESLKLSEPDDGHSAKRRRLFEESKRKAPRCEECGSKVSYLKVADRYVLCYPHAHLYDEWKEAANAAKGRQSTEFKHSPKGNTNLEALRKEQGMGRAALARASGVSAESIRSYETGKTRSLKPATRKALWDVLEKG